MNKSVLNLEPASEVRSKGVSFNAPVHRDTVGNGQGGPYMPALGAGNRL